ncbi:putative T6SS immunity periplasmic lipoprotein [Dryocola sp. BD586]|uniref:putative T6SS immunity periplasmic lipoprotein n=1 Tax=Dryocola sp. BD586 TaxID=3133271 RepID=UPI003F4FC7C9
MIRCFCLLLLFIQLSGCEGDRLTFRNGGDADVGNNLICIKSTAGDTLSYYNLSSSFNDYREPLVAESNIVKKFPDTCMKVRLRSGENYTLLYELNEKKYRFEFRIDEGGNVINTTRV